MADNSVFCSINNIEEKSDEEIVQLIKGGNQEALDYLMKKYKDLVNNKVSKFFIIGAEKEDIVQEGLIGLYKAIKCFNSDKEITFKSFANLCIQRQVITAIKSSTRQKHVPLNSYLSLNTSAYEDDDTTIIELIENNLTEDPLDTLMKKEYYSMIETKMNDNLSGFEKKVIHGMVRGESYVDIANKLGSSVKSVDNAIQRIRRKALNNFEE